MPRDEGVGFPLGLAGTGGAVDCYLSLRKSCILMVSARAGEGREYWELKGDHLV